MRDIDEVFAALSHSRFRRGFGLSAGEREYLRQKGLAAVLEHARGFVTARMADAEPANDGRQTPMKNHPVFVAQHATGTCCRKCLQKWHHIRSGGTLTKEQIDYIVSVIRRWLDCQGV